MISAFGVDHGGYEVVEKLSVAGIGTKLAGQAVKGGNLLRRSGAGGIRSSASQVKPAGTGVRGFMGRTQMRAGGGLKKLGTGMAARPGLTGGIAAGGATAGVGGAGFMAGKRRY